MTIQSHLMSFIFMIIICSILGCSDSGNGEGALNGNGEDTDMILTSTAFTNESMIPAKYTCDDEDLSIPLAWSNAPDETVSYALISDDPDAPGGTWIHWVVYNIPGTTTNLAEDASGSGIPESALEGTNSWSNIGYGGPCPPSGTHRYYFKLYSLDAMLGLSAGATKAELLAAMAGHILSQAQLMGRYTRG